MALGAYLRLFKFQGGRFHSAADHGDIVLVAFRKAVLGAPLHHLVLGLLRPPAVKALHTEYNGLLAAVHTQHGKAAHQKHQKSLQIRLPFLLHGAQHRLFNET